MLHVLQREHHPTAQHAAAHGRDGAVDDIEQRFAVFLHRLKELKRADGELIQPHVFLFLQALERRNMIDIRVLRQLQILHDGTRGDDAFLEMLYAEAFQRLGTEMLQQLLPGVLLREHPVVELEDRELRAEILFKLLALRLVVEHLFRREVANELLHIVVGALSGEKLTRGDVEETDTAGCLAEVDRCQEVVLLIVQHIITHGDSWRDELRDASLYHLVHLCEPLLAFYHGTFLLRVFELVAYRHAFSGADKLRQISIEGMVREAGHLCAC